MRKRLLNKRLPLAVFILALFLFMLSMAGNGIEGDTERVARRMENNIRQRLDILDRHINKVLDSPPETKAHIDPLPEDMVIYRYVNDSLQAWSNQFSVLNDDISNRMVFQRLTNLKNRLISPLAEVTEHLSFTSLGPKWYLVKSVNGLYNDKVIAGIEIQNTLINDVRRNDNGVNPNLKLSTRYTVLPLNHSGGSVVTVEGRPLFKILRDTSSSAPFFDNSFLRWMSLLLFAIATVLFLAGHRTRKVYLVVMCTLSLLFLMAYIWGVQMNGSADIFSPNLYADGTFFFSLGALLLTNTYITLFFICAYLVRADLVRFAQKSRKRRKRNLTIYITVAAISAICILIYTHLSLKSLIYNSNISMELYLWNDRTTYTILVYLSYMALMFCIIQLMQMCAPAIRELTGRRFDFFSLKWLAAFAFVSALYLSVASSKLGFQKEQDRIMVWANRLAVDRDLGLEIRLRSVEEAIASDQLISTLSSIDKASGMILNRITENYLSRIRQSHGISIMTFKDQDQDAMNHFTEIVRNGTPIAENSRFLFVTDGNGSFRYAGTFLFYSKESGITRMLLEIEPNSNKDDQGYKNLMGKFSTPGEINIPAIYSYAKYSDGRLMSYKGNFPYPTIFDKSQLTSQNDKDTKITHSKGFTHFNHKVSDNEVVIISRPQRHFLIFFTSFSYIFLLLLGITYAFVTIRKNRSARHGSNYFKTRINTILLTSSSLILATLTTVSVLFVYKRNEDNMHNLMSSKITTIQALLDAQTKYARGVQDLISPTFKAAVENVSSTTKSDITLYTPAGEVFHSTSPDVFEKMIIGNRIDQEAFHNIRHLNQRFFISKARVADFSYWALYAPLFNDNKEMMAIISVPYTDSGYDFQREAFFHAALLVNLFILLLIMALLFSTREVNALFSPLSEMGKKMNAADINNLEYIIYKRDDEISSLVDAYNRMVKELSDSSLQLAQAERDKAWSQMARQVAHEIKNPLTPIKLEIQRLIRLKQKGNPKWEEKFDQVSSVVLEHIDILTDTANEFSTFAKLYSEDPVVMDLDRTLKDQLMIFDNREGIRIRYIGMESALVKAPKPQLIRVFVNLITNAVQAVEIMRKEAQENGEEAPLGRVLICLRNSTRDGCYDVVFDDNGPGVKDENLSKLFTPNFTTKSGGTGLGLAICRNIVEKCDGEISYQKSFGLGGASFTVTLPKYME